MKSVDDHTTDELNPRNCNICKRGGAYDYGSEWGEICAVCYLKEQSGQFRTPRFDPNEEEDDDEGAAGGGDDGGAGGGGRRYNWRGSASGDSDDCLGAVGGSVAGAEGGTARGASTGRPIKFGMYSASERISAATGAIRRASSASTAASTSSISDQQASEAGPSRHSFPEASGTEQVSTASSGTASGTSGTGVGTLESSPSPDIDWFAESTSCSSMSSATESTTDTDPNDGADVPSVGME